MHSRPPSPIHLLHRLSSAMLLLGTMLALSVVTGCRSAAPRSEPQLTEAQRQLNVDSLEYIYKTVGDNHYDPEMGGVDWPAVHDELRPRIEQAETMSAARGILNDMIGRLNLSHFAVIPASAYADIDPPSDSAGENDCDRRDGETGIEFRVIGDDVVVTALIPQTPPAEAGVQTGWAIEQIAGKNIPQLVEKVRASLHDSHFEKLALQQAIKKRTRGKIGDSVDVVFRAGDGEKISKTLTLVAPIGEPYVFGNMPTYYVRLDHERMGNIGYIHLNAFFHPMFVNERFSAIMKEFADTDGIIIDLRGNPGGMGGMAMGLSGWFTKEKQQMLGTMITRQAHMKFIINPRANAYTRPLAVLVDELTGSTSEIMAGGLQDLGRARVFGRTTAGAAQPSRFEKLPNGDRLQYAFADYVSVGGQRLEGNGVTPDVLVELNRASFLAKKDPDLEAARAWINEQVLK